MGRMTCRSGGDTVDAELVEPVGDRVDEEVVVLEVAEDGEVGGRRRRRHHRPLGRVRAGLGDAQHEDLVGDGDAGEQEAVVPVPPAVEDVAGDQQEQLPAARVRPEQPGADEDDREEDAELDRREQHSGPAGAPPGPIRGGSGPTRDLVRAPSRGPPRGALGGAAVRDGSPLGTRTAGGSHDVSVTRRDRPLPRVRYRLTVGRSTRASPGPRSTRPSEGTHASATPHSSGALVAHCARTDGRCLRQRQQLQFVRGRHHDRGGGDHRRRRRHDRRRRRHDGGGGATTTASGGTGTCKAGTGTVPPLTTGTADGKGKTVGLLFDVTGRGDKSFNDAAAAALDKAKADFGITGQESTPTAADGSDRPERIKSFAGNPS